LIVPATDSVLHDAMITGWFPITRSVVVAPSENVSTDSTRPDATTVLAGVVTTLAGSVSVPSEVLYVYVPAVVSMSGPVGAVIMHGSKWRGFGVHCAHVGGASIVGMMTSASIGTPTTQKPPSHTRPLSQSAVVEQAYCSDGVGNEHAARLPRITPHFMATPRSR